MKKEKEATKTPGFSKVLIGLALILIPGSGIAAGAYLLYKKLKENKDDGTR